MVDGVDSQLLKMQMIQNSDSDTPTQAFYMSTESQYLKCTGHVCRCPNTKLTKKMLFAKSRRPYKRDPWRNIAKSLNVFIEQAKRSTPDKSGFAALVDRVFAGV